MIDTVALWMILAVLLLFIFIFAVRIRVTIELQNELYLTVTVCGINIRILPKKPKRYNVRNYTPKKIAKRDKKALLKAQKKAARDAEKKAEKAEKKRKKKEEQAKLTKAEKKAIKAKKKASRPPIPDIISLFFKVIRLFFSGFLSHFHFHIARVRLKIGGSDAAQTAMLYGIISTAAYPILSFLDKHSNLHGMKNADIDISPDFLSEEISADIKIGFSMSLGGLLGVVFRAAFSFIFGWIKIKPSGVSNVGHITDDTKSSSTSPSQADAAGDARL